MKRALTIGIRLLCLALTGSASQIIPPIEAQTHFLLFQFASPAHCTTFCLDKGDHCVFGANLDNTIENGLLFVNKRNVLKKTWDPSTSGEYAQWVSRYGSVTFNLIGYQMVWSGMNEAGLMISTMSVA